MLSASKIFGTSPQATLYDASYINTVMYAKAMPMYGDGGGCDKDKPLFDESKDACSSDNFKNFTEDEIIYA